MVLRWRHCHSEKPLRGGYPAGAEPGRGVSLDGGGNPGTGEIRVLRELSSIAGECHCEPVTDVTGVAIPETFRAPSKNALVREHPTAPLCKGSWHGRLTQGHD